MVNNILVLAGANFAQLLSRGWARITKIFPGVTPEAVPAKSEGGSAYPAKLVRVVAGYEFLTRRNSFRAQISEVFAKKLLLDSKPC